MNLNVKRNIENLFTFSKRLNISRFQIIFQLVIDALSMANTATLTTSLLFTFMARPTRHLEATAECHCKRNIFPIEKFPFVYTFAGLICSITHFTPSSSSSFLLSEQLYNTEGRGLLLIRIKYTVSPDWRRFSGFYVPGVETGEPPPLLEND